MNFKNLSIGVKLPMSFALVTLAVVTTTAFLAHSDFRKELVHETNVKLDVLTYERSQSIATWFEMIRDRVAVFGNDKHVVGAAQGMAATFGLLMDDPVADLQAAYIYDNPHPTGEKDLLDQAETDLPYDYQHATHHPFFRDVKNGLGLYDVFIFDLDGNLIYSVYKEADFATNFIDGDYSDSGLGTAFRQTLEGEAGSVQFVDFAPYEPSANAPASFMSTPIVGANGKTIGVFAIQLPSDLIDYIVNHPEGQGQTGEITLIATDNMARTDSRFEDGHRALGDLTLPQHIADSIDNGGGFFVDMPGLNGKPAVSVLHDVEILGETWHMLAEVETSEVFQALTTQRNKTIIVSAIAILVSALVAWLLSRSVTQPVISVTESMTKIGNRDYKIDTSGSTRGDEVGSLYRALETMSERSQEFDERVEAEKQLAAAQEFAVQKLGMGLKQLAKKDFSHEISTPFAPQFEALRKDFNITLRNLNTTMSQLIQFSKMIETQTQKMSTETSQLSNRTENQAATLEETAAAVDQITAHVKSSSGELKSAEELVLETNNKAISGQQVLNDTSKAMTEIEHSSNEISKIVGVVDDIAFQTNLLALNAGVEAARAGEAGRGFAVVATEVRQLAQRATDSVSQISSLIENSGQAVAQGVELVGSTDEALVEIVERIEAISNLIMSVTASSSEQSEGLAEINIGVSQLDQATQQNASMVDQSSNMAQQLKSEALNLVGMLEDFDLLIDNDGGIEIVDADMKESETRAA